MLESDSHDVGVLVVKLVDLGVVHHVSSDEEVREIGHESV